MLRAAFLSVLFLMTPLSAGELDHVKLDDPYDADAFVDAAEIASSENPYLLIPHVLSVRRAPTPFESDEAARCWTDTYDVRYLDGFTDAIAGYETIRMNKVLALYVELFNRRVLQIMKREGRTDCAF